MGFEYADITDIHPGSWLGRDAGFTAQVNLDDNPYDSKRTFEKYGLKISTCRDNRRRTHSERADKLTFEEKVYEPVCLATDLGVTL
jgi:hypothetical protein